jgi:hypothetical protein
LYFVQSGVAYRDKLSVAFFRAPFSARPS